METVTTPAPSQEAVHPALLKPLAEADIPVLRDAYRHMLFIRRIEEAAAKGYGQGKIGGFLHLVIGQESICVGSALALRSSDYMVTSYREHGHFMAKAGSSLDSGKAVLAELWAKDTGCSRGLGGSMHMFSAAHRFLGGYGIVGAQVPLGTGLAFAHKYREDGGICVAYMGDGAVNQGQVYESFNMAALWQLPILYVIENNRYAMGTAQARAAAGQRLCERGTAYGIPGHQVDGMDVVEVHRVARDLVEQVRSGTGPVILEAMTYRYRGHSMSDPAKYRTKEEVQEMRERHDPIEGLRKRIADAGVAGDEDFKRIDKEIRDVVNEAARFAQDSPEPDPAELWTDILIEA